VQAGRCWRVADVDDDWLCRWVTSIANASGNVIGADDGDDAADGCCCGGVPASGNERVIRNEIANASVAEASEIGLV